MFLLGTSNFKTVCEISSSLVKFTKLNAINLIIVLRKDPYYLSDLESLQTIKNLH